MRSMTVRSISPSAPITSNSAFLPISPAICRTILRSLGTIRENGTMRVRIKPSCNSELTRACCCNNVSGISRSI